MSIRTNLTTADLSNLVELLSTIDDHVRAGAEVAPWGRFLLADARIALSTGTAIDVEQLWFDVDNLEWQLSEQVELIAAER